MTVRSGMVDGDRFKGSRSSIVFTALGQIFGRIQPCCAKQCHPRLPE